VHLTQKNIAGMIDLSCVRTNNTKADIDELVQCAREYQIGQVTVLQSFIPYTKELIKDNPEIRLSGNVSFPSGSDSISFKLFQTRELVENGCDEIDMVMNVGKFLSGEYTEVEADIRAVVQAAHPLPVKVIIEMVYLDPAQVEIACELSISAGAAFIKTGTGWIGSGTTVDDIKLIKSIVGDRIQIKASGGIRDLETLVAMYAQGARRFGVNLRSGIQIVEECTKNPEKLSV
jgi:deoxyribose-phosphate aldolase